MSTLSNYSKTVWFPLIFIVAFISIDTSWASAQQIQWHQDLAEAKAEARDTNRLVWLHFTADWCVPCKRLESFVFKNTGVIRASDRNTVAVKVDADAQASLVKQLDVPRIPYDVVMTPSGRVIVNRPSPKNSSDFLMMFNGLDRPLQALNSGDREVINAQLDQLHGVIQKTGGSGLRQKQSDLDLEGPSHQMASTTVEGQRLERGFESNKRAAEMRSKNAKLLKQKAEMFIAEEEERQQRGQGPKISENPFFKTTASSAASNAFPKSANQSQAVATSTPKTVSNAFVKTQNAVTQQQSIKVDPTFVPPLPPSFENKTVKKVAASVASQAGSELKSYDERQEFSFASKPYKKASEAAKKVVAKQTLSLEAPKLTTPKQPEFKKPFSSKAASSDFAYAPIDNLRKTLRSNAAATAPPQSPVAKKSQLSLAVPDRPIMKSEVSTPKAPVMVEGIVQIGEANVSAAEGRLVSAEQTIVQDTAASSNQSQSPIQKQISRTDRLLENVNFFATDTKPVQSGPNTFAVPAQPVPQPQIVINLNTGNTASPQSTSQSVVVQPSQGVATNKVALASSNSAVANQATVSNANIASAVRSKYALKGKCPVTLMSEGRWVDGNTKIGCVHRDRVYLFASAAKREAFLADPDKMSPLLAGFDPVIFEETGKLIEGEETFGTFMGKKPNQRIVLFKTADTRERFQKEPAKYLDVVRNAMAGKASKENKFR